MIEIHSGDEHMAVLPGPDGAFILLGYYKQRGRTQVADVVNTEGKRRPLTLADIQWWMDDKQEENVRSIAIDIAVMRLNDEEQRRAFAIISAGKATKC